MFTRPSAPWAIGAALLVTFLLFSHDFTSTRPALQVWRGRTVNVCAEGIQRALAAKAEPSKLTSYEKLLCLHFKDSCKVDMAKLANVTLVLGQLGKTPDQAAVDGEVIRPGGLAQFLDGKTGQADSQPTGGRTKSRSGMIPKMMHARFDHQRFWEAAQEYPSVNRVTHSYAKANLNRWRLHFPDYQIVLWEDKDLLQLAIKTWPGLAKSFQGKKIPDPIYTLLFKYLVLYNYGGIWVEGYTEPLVSLRPIFNALDAAVVGDQTPGERHPLLIRDPDTKHFLAATQGLDLWPRLFAELLPLIPEVTDDLAKFQMQVDAALAKTISNKDLAAVESLEHFVPFAKVTDDEGRPIESKRLQLLTLPAKTLATKPREKDVPRKTAPERKRNLRSCLLLMPQFDNEECKAIIQPKRLEAALMVVFDNLSIMPAGPQWTQQEA